MNLIAGIDEAGRGCLIGPMAVCGVCIEEGVEESIRAAGIRDSKQLRPKKREELAKVIYRMAQSVKVVLVSPAEIDQENLNVLTMKKTVELINYLTPDVVYLDVPSRGNGIKKYCQAIHWMLKNTHPPSLEELKNELVSTTGRKGDLQICGENKADQNYPVVAAASIIAKVTRDQEILNLQHTYGDFGSGYPSDPKTRDFAQKYICSRAAFPPIIRTKWATVARFMKPQQGELFVTT